ncbi:ribose transport system ATP-binding protein/rhamnose transport system ATP-binding protein [Hydrogenispora ethanolica]|uniref:Ribose transport system ATP-binding protein/rhamnose transport system ATP-binding protein n=1 Tax=Hydrogenispora ethanolica TaxID=1082276 RepID=A0A4R1RU22_HYDET|nr:sugar ABC transporter ATP-binding protein [Hydrogenispora ethanolica]TCL69884.1 ribose transport system ATP-binding protein/rhamnose transport system ATP-binding protein [Hydrogenispora ethanolica]
MQNTLLAMVNIWKTYPNGPVLKGVDFTVRTGEIHGLLGKNGAGKSMLMKVLSGIVPLDSGSIYWRGEAMAITSVKQAMDLGISAVHQELCLFPELSVAENIMVEQYQQRGLVKHGIIERERVYHEAQSILDELHFEIDAHGRVADLSFAQQQMVEIARALSRNAELLILDEPTTALNEREVSYFFKVLHKIRQRGVAIVYITHRLKEIRQIADRITILRDGVNVGTLPVESLEGAEIIRLMVGEEALGRYPKLGLPTRNELLRVEHLSMGNVLSDISFTLREGEMLGIAGLAGSGRTALVNSIFGMASMVTGKMFLRGREVRLRSPQQAIKLGLAYLAEDRVRAGLFNNLSVKDNISATNLKRVTAKGVIDIKKETLIARGLTRRLGIGLADLQQRVAHLSGGNQQKTMVAKWLFSGGFIYLLDEPTCGLDIASKVDLYNILNSFICGGSGVIIISSDLSELIGMCHRVLVIYQGRIAGELEGNEISEEKILKLASGRE